MIIALSKRVQDLEAKQLELELKITQLATKIELDKHEKLRDEVMTRGKAPKRKSKGQSGEIDRQESELRASG